jgi:hypothetical protein
MDLNQLEKLLHKYLEGKTSESEEATLRQELAGTNVPAEFKPMSELFAFYDAENAGKTLGQDFDLQVLAKVEKSQNPARIGLLWKMSGIAATLLLAVSLTYMAFNQETTPVLSEATYTDPREAFEETKKALMMLSDRFGEGTRHVEKLETFSEVQEEIVVN